MTNLSTREKEYDFVDLLIAAALDGEETGDILISGYYTPNGNKVACIEKLSVRPTNGKHGTKVLGRICDVADANNIKLELSVSPMTKQEEVQRINFFGKAGFVIEETAIHMERTPEGWNEEIPLDERTDFFSRVKRFINDIKTDFRREFLNQY